MHDASKHVVAVCHNVTPLGQRVDPVRTDVAPVRVRLRQPVQGQQTPRPLIDRNFIEMLREVGPLIPFNAFAKSDAIAGLLHIKGTPGLPSAGFT